MNTIDTLIRPVAKYDFTVVLIDTDASLAIEVENRLRKEGCTLLHALSAEEVPPLLMEKPDFILIDPDSDAAAEFDLKAHLHDPYGPGIVIWTADKSPEERNGLFADGVLDLFSKNDPPGYLAQSLQKLCHTIHSNPMFHISIISPSQNVIESIKRLIGHRRYGVCTVASPQEVCVKWDNSEHELPDLLLLHATSDNLEEAFILIRELRTVKISEIPLIVLADGLGAHNVHKLFREGASEVIECPYHPESLFVQITSHLDYRIDRVILNYEKNLSLQIKTMIDSKSIVSKTDPRGIITYVNDRFAQISGYRPEELIGQPHNIIRHPDNHPSLYREMWSTIRNKQIFRGIIRNRRKDGTSYYVDSMITPVMDDNDKIIEYVSIRHDITELIEKQHELEEQRLRVQNVLDAQTSLVCMVDKHQGVIQSNQRFSAFTGTSNPKELHHLFLDIEGSLRISEAERHVWLDKLYGIRDQFTRVAMSDPFGNPHMFALHVEKIPDEHFSEGICYLVTFEDVTELSRALREAQLSSEAESRFLATMSHEIRTPLNGILGFAELLRDSDLSDEQAKYLQAIEYSGETLRQIINDILEVMKLDREALVLNVESFNLIAQLEAILYPFYAHAAKKGVELLVFIDPRLPVTVHTDLLRLKQVLINLINNAIKFTPQGKSVCIRVKNLRQSKGNVTLGITVADEGIGVKPEHRGSIFKPFVQADNSIAREYGGTGLGLNIVTRIIAAMGGNIAFKSKPGSGSVFYVRLSIDCDDASYRYHCRREKTYLYLPISMKPTYRFMLMERYLKRFECCGDNIQRVSDFDKLDDIPGNSVIIFAQLISMAQIASAVNRFLKTKIYLVASYSQHPFLPTGGKNVIRIPDEITWSNIVKTFEIYHPDSPLPQPKEEDVRFDGLRVLAAEDNEVNRFLIDELLKKMGIHADLAKDGLEALQRYRSDRYDLILMDINMPNLDGISTVKQIRSYEQNLGAIPIPIYALSADAVAKNISRYMTSGLDGYLIKPLVRSNLVEILHQHFKDRVSLSPETADNATDANATSCESADVSFASQIAQQLDLPLPIVNELFTKFIANARVLLEALNLPQDETQLKTTLHSLKGIAKNLFFHSLGDACARLETELSGLDAIGRDERLASIRSETESIIRQIEQEINP